MTQITRKPSDLQGNTGNADEDSNPHLPPVISNNLHFNYFGSLHSRENNFISHFPWEQKPIIKSLFQKQQKPTSALFLPSIPSLSHSAPLLLGSSTGGAIITFQLGMNVVKIYKIIYLQ